MGLEIKVFPFGPTDIGKSSLIDFITKGRRPQGQFHSTVYYTPFSESIPFYRRDWERISNKIFKEILPDFVNYMMRDAISADEPEFKQTYLKSCNRHAEDEDAKIIDLDEAYTIIQISGPDTGGQKKYEEILPHVADFCRDYTAYLCFRNIEGNIDDLEGKINLIKNRLKNYSWRSTYFQLQTDQDPLVSDEQIERLKGIRDSPIYQVSSQENKRYDILDIFVTQALVTTGIITQQ